LSLMIFFNLIVILKFEILTIMRKITILSSSILLLFLAIILNSISLQAKEASPLQSTFYQYSQNYRMPKSQDENLIKGNWQSDAVTAQLQITGVLANGLLEVNYRYSKLVFIEKSGWTNSSNVLRLFILFQQENKSGYSLTLNYLPEKDLLVGVYVDGSNDTSSAITFKRAN
jgi:hypothetical protein